MTIQGYRDRVTWDIVCEITIGVPWNCFRAMELARPVLLKEGLDLVVELAERIEDRMLRLGPHNQGGFLALEVLGLGSPPDLQSFAPRVYAGMDRWRCVSCKSG